MAAQQTRNRQPGAAHSAMRVDRFRGVGRATGIETALAPEERAKTPLVQLDQKDQDFFHRAPGGAVLELGMNQYIAAFGAGFCNPRHVVLIWTRHIRRRDTTMFKRGLMQIVLAALLLVAQHGALTHQVRHLQDRLPAQAQQQDPKQKSAHAGLCDFHVSFAQVLGVVHCAQMPLRLASNGTESTVDYFQSAYPADLVVPASRGPPILL